MPAGLLRIATRDRTGFTFVELIVALAIMIMMAAVVTPVLLGSLDSARVDTSQKSLFAIRDGIYQFHEDVGDYNGLLSDLSSEITTSDRNICGMTYPPGHVSKWDGPYMHQIVPNGGLPIAIGRVRNELFRYPLTNNPDYLFMQVDSVRAPDAVALNEQVDGADGDANPALPGLSNSITWTSPIDGIVTLFYALPIHGC